MTSQSIVSQNLGTLTEPPASGGRLSLRDLHRALEGRGVVINYGSLSEMLKVGDIAEQLGAGGTGSRREFLPEVADILAAFLPEFRAAGGKTPQVAVMMRSFLQSRGQMVRAEPSASAPLAADAVALAEAQGRAQGLAQTERVLTAKEAAELLQISVGMLRRTIKPYRRFGKSAQGDRWLLSELLTA